MSAASEAPRGLLVRLDRALPARLQVGHGNAVFIAGACAHEAGDIESLEVRAPSAAAAWTSGPMPRHDLLAAGLPGAAGFWAILAVAPGAETALEVELRARLAGGETHTSRLAEIELVAGRQPPAEPLPDGAAANAAIAICMATYNPSAPLLRAQLDSIRAQTRRDWVCLISDDCSSPEAFAVLEAEVGDDPRFFVSRSERRLGIYRNFERALAMAPDEVSLVAFADQDDLWRPEKLERLAAGIGEADLIYSDARIASEDGSVLSDTYWTRRANNWTNLASLAIANTVTGAASLFRRELVEVALPFPDAPGELYHDHWLALVALAGGSIRYLDEPLYDYVQHGDAALGHAVANALEPGEVEHPGFATGIRRRFERTLDWRELYFFQLVRIQVLATVLLLRRPPSDPRKARTLERLARLDRVSAVGWLGVRWLRRLGGRNETLGLELGLVRAIAWRRLTAWSRGRSGGRQWQRGAALPAEVVETDVVSSQAGDDAPEDGAGDRGPAAAGLEPRDALADRERE